jgi:heat shock protein HtpX
MKRMSLLALTNLVIIVGISTIGYLFNWHMYLNKVGIDYKYLLLFCTIWGFLGSFVSLLLSKFVAKWFMRVRIIDQKEPKLSFFEKQLIKKIVEISANAGIKTPEIGFYDANEINAFATGPSKNNSLIAFTSNIFNVMDWEEIEGVIAHEISHIKNGDMVNMTLLQGLVNVFSMFLSRMIGFTLINAVAGEKGKFFFFTYYIYNWIILFFEGIFLFCGSIVTKFYSRRREFNADKGAAELIGKRKVIKALYCLMKFENPEAYKSELNDQVFANLKINNFTQKNSFFGLFSTHPSLEKRIKRVKDLDIDESVDNMDLSKMTINDII